MKELKRYLSYMGRYKYGYWTVFVLTLLLGAVTGLTFAQINKVFFNAVEYGDSELYLRAVILCLVYMVAMAGFPYMRYFQIHIVRKIVFDIKLRLFHKLIKADMNYYEKNHSGDALKTLNWDANSLKDSYFSHIYWVVGKLTNGVTSMVAMFLYSPSLALVSIFFSVVTVYLSITINKQIKKMDKKIQGSLSNLTQKLSDILSGFALLKMYQGATVVLEHFEQRNEGVTGEEKQRSNKAAMLEMLSFLMGIMSSFGTIIVGAIFVSQGKLDYGTIMAVVSLQMSVSGMVQRFGFSLTTLSGSLVKAGRVFDFLEADIEEKERGELTQSAANVNVCGGIGMRDLCFAYREGENVLQNFNLQVAPGEKVLILGESGCGKSTLLKLLLGFYDKTSGEITIGGKPVEQYSLEEMRSMMTYMPQSSYLFEGTVRENIALGSSAPEEVTEEQIRRAAKMAYADEFIDTLPNGYDTVLTAGGSNLSGGQRQRIAIARAFLKDSPILLMDEPSSALDVQSEKMINMAMQELMRNRIVLLVTHRENAYPDFDRVVRLG